MRFISLVLAILWVTPASAQTVLQAANGTAFEIADTSTGALSQPASFENWPKLCVRVCDNCAANPGLADQRCEAEDIYNVNGSASQALLNGRLILMANDQLAGLTVSRMIYVPDAGPEAANGWARYSDAISNQQANPITVSVRIGSTGLRAGTLNPNASTVFRTSDDDADLEPTDRWFMVDDDQPNGGIGAAAVLFQGAGTRGTAARAGTGFPLVDDDSAVGWEFREVTVNPGETLHFVTILVYEATRADALEEITGLVRMRDVDATARMADGELERTYNFDLDPANPSPVADAGGPYNADEGEPVNLTATAYDTDRNGLTYAWDLTDDGLDNFDIDGSNVIHTFPDDGTRTVRVRVTDNGGKVDIDPARVVIRNVDPIIVSVGTTSPINEGDFLVMDVRVNDPGNDDLTYDYDWDGDGVFDDVGTDDAGFRRRYFDDGVYNAQVRVRDGDGGESIGQFEVVVNNLEPEIFQLVAPQNVSEGTEFGIQIIAQDRGRDPITYGYDLDFDGRFEREGVGLDQITFSLPDDGLYQIRVRACDDQNACSTNVAAINVLNEAPEIADVNVNSPVDEGEIVDISVVAADLGDDSLLYAFDFDGDGDFELEQASPDATFSLPDEGVHSIGIRVRDDDGAADALNVEVVARNVNPTALIQGLNVAREGQALNLVCDGRDQGIADILSYDWDLDGDGEFEVLGGHAVQSPAFEQQGTLTVRCRVSDGDGGVAIAEHEVIVSNEIPTLRLETDQAVGNEGAEIVVRAIADDPSDDELTYSFDFDDDGIIDQGPDPSPIGRHTYPDQGVYIVRAEVSDGTDRVSANIRIEIQNVAPSIELTTNSPVDEGGQVILTVRVSDPGDDTITVHWDLDGDGDIDEVDDPVDGVVERVMDAPDDARYNIDVTAQDEDRGSRETSAAVIIRNLPPFFVEGIELPPAIEGQPYNRVVPASDPAGVEDPITYRLVAGPDEMELEAFSGLIDWTPSYESAQAGTVNVIVSIDDGDNGQAQTELSIAVQYQDDDRDGLPDTYERLTCNEDGVCLDPDNPADAQQDPDGDGRSNLDEFLEETNPFVYEGAQPPILVSPEDGLRVPTLTPTLATAPVETDLGGEISIVFGIYADENLENLVIESDPIPEAEEGDTTWTPDEGFLFEDAWYYWRARAQTDAAITEWSEVRRFRTNATNEVPSTPMLISPPDGTTVDTRQPRLEVAPATDLDEDTLFYRFRVYRRTGEVYTSGDGVLMGDRIVFEAMGLIEDAEMSWDVVAVDEAAAESEPSEKWSFRVDTMNKSPEPPVIDFPEPDMMVETLEPVFRASGSTDIENDAISYVFEVRLAAGDVVEQSDPVEPGAEGAQWTPSSPLTEDTHYTLNVHAVDARGAASETVSVNFFASAENHPPTVPVQTSPVDGAEFRLSDAILLWDESTDPEEGPVEYVVEYCIDGGDCAQSDRLDRKAFNLSDDGQAGAGYTWTVEAFDAQGSGSGKSEERRFTITAAPVPPEEGCECDLSAESRPSPLNLVLLGFGLMILGVRRRRPRG